MSGESSYKDGLGTEIGIFCLILLLSAASVASSFVNWGLFNTVILLTNAFIITALILIFFMHLKESSGFIKLFIFGAFLWVGVMFAMTLNDFLSRDFVANKLAPKTWVTRSAHQFSETPAVSEHQG